MVQLRPGEAGFEPAAGHDDGFDLRLAQTRFVVIGFEERTRAAARHLSSRKIEGPQMRLEAERKAAAGGGLCRFLDFKANRSLSLRFWATREMDSNLRFPVARPSKRHVRRDCSRNGSGSVGEPKVRIHLPPAQTLQTFGP